MATSTGIEDSWAKVPKALKKMGYASLRPAQEECLKSILGGKDTFVVLPTGGGKTLLAAIPALVLDTPVVIFSPLVALMVDQAYQLNTHRVRAGFISSAHNEDQNSIEVQDWLEEKTKVLLVAPERLKDESFRVVMRYRPPGMVVLDEAHCLSQWSSTFRPEYAKVGDFISEASPKLVLAMTATATKEIYEEVQTVLGRKLALQRHYTPRQNLHLFSHTVGDMWEAMVKVAEMIKSDPGKSTIIYCGSVAHVGQVAGTLSGNFGLDVTYYHGQMTNSSDKLLHQDLFMSGKVPTIVATNAFGMGIDKPDIRRVIHLDPPLSLESLSQEIGRAGRDGKDSECVLFLTPEGQEIQDTLWRASNPTSRTVREVLEYFRSSLDPMGVAHIPVSKIEKALGDDKSVNAAVAFLVSRGIIERRDGAKLATITEVEGRKPKTYAQSLIMDAVHRLGVKNSRGEYNVDIPAVANYVMISKDSVKQHLRNMRSDGTIIYEPPSRTKDTVITGELTEEDLKFIDARRKVEEEKLLNVRKYARTPDAEKQDFLTQYFSRAW